MSYRETLTVNSSMGGQFTKTRYGEDRIGRKIPVPAALAGVVTSHADGAAVLTLGADHGITTDDLVGLFWAAGQRLDMVVSAVGATTITVTMASGVGTPFPADATAITVGVQVARDDITFNAAGMQMLVVGADAQNVSPAPEIGANFVDASSDSLLHAQVVMGESYDWASRSGPANPIDGTVAAVNCYNGSLVATEVQIAILLAATT